eukprot:TRINITY_DN65553_c0_g3_i3.p1 TRINITY_DN65553_c0_g3~~TRINITY_DN65553_c0_g3_i3.p1  ORF type:complete len:171 (+),score=7.76 TRINITY_DN65553_c0_g3_i3:461-973(+)
MDTQELPPAAIPKKPWDIVDKHGALVGHPKLIFKEDRRDHTHIGLARLLCGLPKEEAVCLVGVVLWLQVLSGYDRPQSGWDGDKVVTKLCDLCMEEHCCSVIGSLATCPALQEAREAIFQAFGDAQDVVCDWWDSSQVTERAAGNTPSQHPVWKYAQPQPCLTTRASRQG